MTARRQPREDIAVMLRDGATYRAITQALGVSRHAITATRKHFKIPHAPTGLGHRIDPEQRQAIEQRVCELARAGATYQQITDEVGITAPTIAAIRDKHGLPRPGRTPPVNPTRTITEAFALYTQADDDGHVHWTGPHAGRMPTFGAENGRHNARHIAFRLHHGRDPHGYVRNTPTCTTPGCLAGAHLTDHTIRNQPTPHPTDALDALYDAIFGGHQ